MRLSERCKKCYKECAPQLSYYWEIGHRRWRWTHRWHEHPDCPWRGWLAPNIARGRQWPPERDMLDWLTRPADWLLSAGGFVASWFFSKDATSFTVVQMMFATLMLAAFLSLIVCWQTLVEYWRSHWKAR